MKKGLKIFVVLITGLLLAGITFTVNKAYIKKHTELIPVAVAKETVGPYSQLKNYELAQVVKSSIPEDAVMDLKYLQDKEWFTGKLGIGEGDIIRKSRLKDSDTNPFGPVLALENNKVLVGVKTDQVLSAGRTLKSGVIAHGFVFIPSKDRGIPDIVKGPQQDPLLKDLLVKEVQNAEATDLAEKGQEAIPVVVVIETTIPVAQQLIYYQEIGKLYLAPKGVDMATALKVTSEKSKDTKEDTEEAEEAKERPGQTPTETTNPNTPVTQPGATPTTAPSPALPAE